MAGGRAMTENDREDLLTDYFSQLEESACEIVALAKEKKTNAESIVYVDSDGNDKSVAVYDCRYHIWKSADTLDKIADDLLGSAEYGTLIAYYNGIQNESEIESGTKIKIPILTEETNANNRIYAIPEKWNNYGTDIALDDSGDFAVSGNDVKTVSGIENLSQAIELRLATASAKRIRLSSYGIRSNIGDPVAVESYLLASIEQTLKAESRISEIEEIKLKGRGDSLYISIVYTDLNANRNEFEGSI